eukprot:scaffold135588_cov37-Prasinocladus_malaysianus.AAC.1
MGPNQNHEERQSSEIGEVSAVDVDQRERQQGEEADLDQEFDRMLREAARTEPGYTGDHDNSQASDRQRQVESHQDTRQHSSREGSQPHQRPVTHNVSSHLVQEWEWQNDDDDDWEAALQDINSQLDAEFRSLRM